MAHTPETRFSLRRWSQRKLAAARGESRAQDAVAAPPMESARADAARRAEGPSVAADSDAHLPATSSLASSRVAPRPPVTSADHVAGAPGVALPPLESLTIDSDFSPFMRAGVDAKVRQSALRKLFRDPRFNVMDGLDVYIDDYSIPSPLDPALARTLMQARYIFDPPRTRINAEGHVEDVPAEAAASEPPDAETVAAVSAESEGAREPAGFEGHPAKTRTAASIAVAGTAASSRASDDVDSSAAAPPAAFAIEPKGS